jgi:hypothetical protein
MPDWSSDLIFLLALTLNSFQVRSAYRWRL